MSKERALLTTSHPPRGQGGYAQRLATSASVLFNGASSQISSVPATQLQGTENLQESMDDRQGLQYDQHSETKSLLRENNALKKSHEQISSESGQLYKLLRHVASLVAKTIYGAETNDTFSPVHLSTTETSYENDQLLLSVRDDWSGRGSHATFVPKETIPLEIGRTLGYGANGEVVEITCKGVKLALKKIYHRQQIQTGQMKEIDVLKNMKHHHVVRLVGTFTQKPYLGLLIWPVARCDLSMILEVLDVRISHNSEPGQVRRFSEKLAEHHFSVKELGDIVGQEDERIWSIFGCLTAAIVYLHQNNIRHKDIKPPNILLSPGGIWLTDFGAAKDFTSDLTSTSESLERGTLRYCAPEVFSYQESGRSADIFSLGCVFLEILVVLTDNHTLEDLAELRPSKNKSYEANLDRISQWLALVESAETGVQHLLYEIKQMLNHDRARRPTAKALALRISSIEHYNVEQMPKRLHGSCCDTRFERELNVDKEWIERLERQNYEYQKLHTKIQELVGSF